MSGSSEADLNHTVFIVVPLLVAFFVILGIGWWKRKEIQKRIRGYSSNFSRHFKHIQSISILKLPYRKTKDKQMLHVLARYNNDYYTLLLNTEI